MYTYKLNGPYGKDSLTFSLLLLKFGAEKGKHPAAKGRQMRKPSLNRTVGEFDGQDDECLSCTKDARHI